MASKGAREKIKLGLVIAALSIQKGIEISQKGYQESSSTLKRELDPSVSYRYVRYLPEYLWMGWSDQAITYPLVLSTPDYRTTVEYPAVVAPTSVGVAFVPDVVAPSPSFRY